MAKCQGRDTRNFLENFLLIYFTKILKFKILSVPTLPVANGFYNFTQLRNFTPNRPQALFLPFSHIILPPFNPLIRFMIDFATTCAMSTVISSSNTLLLILKPARK